MPGAGTSRGGSKGYSSKMGYQKTPGAGTSGGGSKGYRKGGGYGGYGSSKGFGGSGSSGGSGGEDSNKKITPISEVDPMLDNIAVQGRCISIWHSHRLNAAHDPYSLDLVLQDAQNNRIQVYIKKEFMFRFEPLFEEGQCYTVSNFGIAENGGRLPLLPHRYKISFYKSTIVTRIEPFDNNTHGFVLEPYNRLLDPEHHQYYEQDACNYNQIVDKSYKELSYPSLIVLSMPYPNQEYTMDGYNRLIYDELAYKKDELREQYQRLYGSLTSEQKGIYAIVMEAVDKDKGGMFFVYGYGGTRKTYMYKTMSVALRSQGEIVLNVASSGIVTLLLEGERTAHSRFAIPINVVEDSMCHIAADNELADLIRKAKLIIWDEAPMINRHCYEAFDRMLKDICRSDRSTILPVIPNSSRQDVVHATINSSYLWEHCTVLKLTVNMRLGSGATDCERKEIQDFTDWILDIGNGNIGGKNDGESTVEFPNNMLIPESDDHVGSIIHETYPHLLQNLWNPEYFQERAILAPTHEMGDMINKHMLSLILGDEKIYESSDSVSVVDADDTNFNLDLYTTYFLNTINVLGLPHHMLTLKIGTPVMCMRNIDQKAGLCNGTRLQILQMGINIIEGKIISGGKVGIICAIPRMVITPSDTKMPFKLNRRQFPVQSKEQEGVEVDIRQNTNFVRAFTTSANVPSIYIHLFWNTLTHDVKIVVYSFQVNEHWLTLSADLLRKALNVTPTD
ncbi:ATP-dependent DNA helicase PIF1-like protein [Tanacetum coccineum]